MSWITELPDRAVLAIDGADRVAFLQGLVSNDVALAAPGRAVWAALLTPQGKWLADFFILADDARLWLDVEASQADMLATKLARMRLRARVTIAPHPDRVVYAAWPDAPTLPDTAISAPDPRLPAAGARILATPGLPTNATPEMWDRHRLALGLPDGSRDLEAEKTVLLEAGFDELNGVSWTKGCYMGQELTARTRYRGLIKRRLVPVAADGPLPPPGTAIFGASGEVGTMRSGRDGNGLAVLRLDALGGPLTSAGASLHVRLPAWIRLPEAAPAQATT